MASCSLQPVMMRYMRPNHSYGGTLTIGIHWCSCAKLFELSSIDGEVRSPMRGREQTSAAFGHCNDFASKSLLWLIMFDIESSLRELYITAGGNNEKLEG